jgi:adenine phosphoribosyltransferase
VTGRKIYSVDVGGVSRDLRLFEVAPGIRIAILNILGDTELVEAAAGALLERVKAVGADVLVTAETKSIPLIHELSARLRLPYVVLRKQYRPYMGDALKVETLSITTGKPQTLYLDEKDRDLLGGKRVILVDDVISTGSTLQAMRKVVEQAGGQTVAEAAVFTEATKRSGRTSSPSDTCRSSATSSRPSPPPLSPEVLYRTPEPHRLRRGELVA